jgi:hypothetical protein
MICQWKVGLRWLDDGDFEDEVFYTLIGNPKKESPSTTNLPCSKVHLEVDSYLYFAIVEQFIKLIITRNIENSTTTTSRLKSG